MFVWVGEESGDDIIVTGRIVLAQLSLYWPSCSVLAEIVIHMIRATFAISILNDK